MAYNTIIQLYCYFSNTSIPHPTKSEIIKEESVKDDAQENTGEPLRRYILRLLHFNRESNTYTKI